MQIFPLSACSLFFIIRRFCSFSFVIFSFCFIFRSFIFSFFSFFSPSAPSAAPSAGASPSAAASSVFSGSTKTVGATTVAITKSLSVIVGTTFSGSFTDDILRLVLISVLSKSTIISLGIFSVGHFNSTFLLTIFKTPPFFNPGDFSELINLTGISKINFEPFQF